MAYLTENAHVASQVVKNPPASAGEEIQGQLLSWKDPLEDSMATHSSVLAWRLSWTEDPGGLQSIGLQRVGYDLSNSTNTFRFFFFLQSSVINTPSKLRAFQIISES